MGSACHRATSAVVRDQHRNGSPEGRIARAIFGGVMRPQGRSILGLCLLLFAWASPVAAITAIRGFSVRGGVNRSGLETEVAGIGDRTGFQVAAGLEMLDSGTLSVLAELEYSWRGFGLEQEETDFSGARIKLHRESTRLDYLSMPLLLKARFRTWGDVRVFGLGGPRAELLIDRHPAEFHFQGVEQSAEETLSKTFEDMNFALAIGGGLEIARSSRAMTIDVRYAMGLGSLESAFEAIDFKSRAIDLSFGIAW